MWRSSAWEEASEDADGNVIDVAVAREGGLDRLQRQRRRVDRASIVAIRPVFQPSRLDLPRPEPEKDRDADEAERDAEASCPVRAAARRRPHRTVREPQRATSSSVSASGAALLRYCRRSSGP